MKIKLREQLRKILAEKDLKINALAREAKVPAKTIHGWLQGRPPRNFDQVKALCDRLEVSLDWLLYGQEREVKNPFEAHREEIVAGVWEVVLRPVKK